MNLIKKKILNKKSLKKDKGLTLIELLIVIAIISILASIVLVNVNNARSRARDSIRKQTIRTIQKALEAYYADNGEYPSAGPNGCFSSEVGGTFCPFNEDFIPGLVPNYISSAPHDPLNGGASQLPSVLANCYGDPAQYLYTANPEKTGYKVYNCCGPENEWDETSPFYDVNGYPYCFGVCSGDIVCGDY